MSVRALQEVLEGVPPELQHPEVNSGITWRAGGDLGVPQRGDPSAIKAADGGAGRHLGAEYPLPHGARVCAGKA